MFCMGNNSEPNFDNVASEAKCIEMLNENVVTRIWISTVVFRYRGGQGYMRLLTRPRLCGGLTRSLFTNFGIRR